jgi:hypothetical protein
MLFSTQLIPVSDEKNIVSQFSSLVLDSNQTCAEKGNKALFSNLGFTLPDLGLGFIEKKKNIQSSLCFGSSDTDNALPTFTHPLAASDVPSGITEFLPPIRNNAVNLELSVPEHSTYEFFCVLLNKLFQKYNLPYVCQRNTTPIGFGIPDIIIYRKNNTAKDIFVIVEVKRDLGNNDASSQIINYSKSLLIVEKGRFMVLSMACDLNIFAFYCTFRLNQGVACVQLGDFDRFSFGSNGIGLLKLLYILQLPWPMYGSMLVLKGNNLGVWKQVRLLGSGSSSEVYEYEDDSGESRVIKFFRSNCADQFWKEVYIYEELSSSNDVSLKMLWHDKQKLIICVNEVKETITTSCLNLRNINQIYDSLQLFHQLTNHVHRDIHIMNILTDRLHEKLFFNDFALAVPINTKHIIRGNPFFSSNRVLLAEENTFLYNVGDDLFSLTFSLIFLQNYQLFLPEFNNVEIHPHTILEKRNELLGKLNHNFYALKALSAAERCDYQNTKKYTLQYFRTLHPWVI